MLLHTFPPIAGMCKLNLCEVHVEFLLKQSGRELWSGCRREADWAGGN